MVSKNTPQFIRGNEFERSVLVRILEPCNACKEQKKTKLDCALCGARKLAARRFLGDEEPCTLCLGKKKNKELCDSCIRVKKACQAQRSQNRRERTKNENIVGGDVVCTISVDPAFSEMEFDDAKKAVEKIVREKVRITPGEAGLLWLILHHNEMAEDADYISTKTGWTKQAVYNLRSSLKRKLLPLQRAIEELLGVTRYAGGS
jgi:hypothetical protein